MFINMKSAKGLKLSLMGIAVLFSLLFVNGGGVVDTANAAPIIKNQTEDLDVLLGQFVFGQPNVLLILDQSGSMARRFGGRQLGNWDGRDVIDDCQAAFGTSSSTRRVRSSHCIENTANLSVCGSVICPFGTCRNQSDWDLFFQCVKDNNQNPSLDLNNPSTSLALTKYCGGICTSSNSGFQRELAASALEAEAGLAQCATQSNCLRSGDNDPACNLFSDYNRFRACIRDTSTGPTLKKAENCTGGTPDCVGAFEFGTSRMDTALNVLFNFLDADNSLASQMCSDPGRQYDGTNSQITCDNYMETPFRDVRNIVRDAGSPLSSRKLPIVGGGGGQSTKLISQLTTEDATTLGARFRSMTYSGVGRWRGCTANGTFRLDQGGFAGSSDLDLQRQWKFFRSETASGGTPLAWILGLDDGSSSGSTIANDALGAFQVQLQTDPAVQCRPEFVVVITDGEDTCAGDRRGPSGSGQTAGSVTTNANRRSSVQAVSNLRTFYARNPVANQGSQFKKEIMVFVIGLGITNPEGVRTLNAMALAGGTHTQGIIRHTDPETGSVVGTVDINAVIPPGSSFDVFKDLGTASGLATNPNGAHLEGCGTLSSERKEVGGVCRLDGTNIFDDAFFNTGTPFSGADEIKDFAFLAQSPEELAQALGTILGFIQTFSTSGVAPAAPQSSTSVALRDRIYLSLLTPLTDQRLWQGRVALYGFVNDPTNPGTKLVVAKPQGAFTNPASRLIFNPDGSLNANAENFYWEAGKNLAERDIDASQRNLLVVDTSLPGTVDKQRDTSGNLLSIKYVGGLTDFTTTNPKLSPIDFGLTPQDVTNPIPAVCTATCPDTPGGACDGFNGDVNDPANAGCVSCVEDCLKDNIIDFMTGRTKILPVGDPLGAMGVGCPDTVIDPNTGLPVDIGSFATCTVRLGSVFHSTPKVVGSPSALFFDVGFQNFAVNFRDRTAVVYVGANDGFLHAFDAGDFVNATPDNPVQNPFTGDNETVSFFGVGTGEELFAFTSRSFIESTNDTAEFPISLPYTNPTEFPTLNSGPDFRFGDMRNYVLPAVNTERSWYDGSPLLADVWIDGYDNGIPDSNSVTNCTSGIVGQPDGQIDICGKEWHTMLFATPRNGGGVITALDVTNVDKTDPSHKKFSGGPGYPRHYWTVFDKNFGNLWPDPVIGRVRMKTRSGGDDIVVDRWVMFVAGGVHPTVVNPLDVSTLGNDIGNAFYVIDIATGKIIYKFARDFSTAPNATQVDPDLVCDFPGTVSAIDPNGDGFIDLVYAGDRCGRLWRFDVSEPFFDRGLNVQNTGITDNPNLSTIETGNDPAASVWSGNLAFCSNTAGNCDPANNFVPTDIANGLHQIFFAPTAALDDLGRRHVAFVTGSRREPSNVDDFGVLVSFIDPYVPRFFNGGVQQTPPAVLNFDDLANKIIEIDDQGITNQFTNVNSATGTDGEFIVKFPNNVPNPQGEKGFGSPVVINRVLIWTTFALDVGGNSSDPCAGATGEGRIFAIDYLTAEPALARVPGAEPLLQGSDDQKKDVSGKTIAFGLPTPSSLSFGARGSVVLVVAFSGKATTGSSQFLVWELPPFPTRTQTLFWEELF